MIPPPLKVAVNLSARQLEDDELIEDITEAFNCSGMKGGRFEFEITKSTLLNNNTRSRLILLALRRMERRLRSTIWDRLFASDLSDQVPARQAEDRPLVHQPDVDAARERRHRARNRGAGPPAPHDDDCGRGRDGGAPSLVTKAGCTNVQGYLLGRPARLAEVLRSLNSWRVATTGSVALWETRSSDDGIGRGREMVV